MARHHGLRRWAVLFSVVSLIGAACGNGADQGDQDGIHSVTYGVPTLDLPNVWELRIADELGYFDDHGVELDLVAAGTSAAAGQQIASQDLNVANVGTSDAISFIQLGAPMQIVSPGLARNSYRIFAQSDITDWAQLEGATISVPGLRDVVRMFTDYVAAENGLDPESYDVIPSGGGGARYAAMESGAAEAAVLFQPLDFVAEEQGFTELAKVWEYLPDFPFAVLIVDRRWAEENGEALSRFLAARQDAIDYFYDRANRDEVIAIALEEEARLTEEQIEMIYDLYVEIGVYSETGRVEEENLTDAGTLLLEHGILEGQLPPYGDLVDSSFIDARDE